MAKKANSMESPSKYETAAAPTDIKNARTDNQGPRFIAPSGGVWGGLRGLNR